MPLVMTPMNEFERENTALCAASFSADGRRFSSGKVLKFARHAHNEQSMLLQGGKQWPTNKFMP